MATVIEVRDLWFKYPGVDDWALRGVNFTLSSGELVAIIGQNGGGKTTLAKNLNGLLKPTKGVVLVDGLDTRSTPTREIVRRVGYVFQNPSHQIFESKVWEEVAYGPRNLGLPEDEVRNRVRWALSLVGLEGFEDHNPYDLDYSKMKLLTIASVLAMKPKVIVLDEPTTGQDHAGRHVLAKLVRQLNSEGFTIVVITHDMRFVAEVAKRVVLMADGRILLDGPTREVLYAVDVLRRAAIKPPQIVQLSLALREIGFPMNALTLAEATEEVARILRGTLK
ncbi:ATP-binding cassette domain-containing protein [Infirmifilum lucidum]|uniref:ATP-binding cassette domain-containing protein n=1 Tax=Infirmifilum lucidum TaxID=2776706 RepID=A0A7L9FFW8_9CREN|nr:ABC transporter ATP-binding protein [Infirmifilum lucidum]QOJ78690.1 ATP-binding cassette domain-containing protein [Infirmifilum lucidum]